MHELSIAQEIINIVKSSLPDSNTKVKFVRIKVGRISGVLPDTLKFCFDSIVNQTELDGAELLIEEVPIKISCNECKTDSELAEPIFLCPRCQSFNVELISGRELSIKEIEVED